jgi:hypothetical protein
MRLLNVQIFWGGQARTLCSILLARHIWVTKYEPTGSCNSVATVHDYLSVPIMSCGTCYWFRRGHVATVQDYLSVLIISCGTCDRFRLGPNESAQPYSTFQMMYNVHFISFLLLSRSCISLEGSVLVAAYLIRKITAAGSSGTLFCTHHGTPLLAMHSNA